MCGTKHPKKTYETVDKGDSVALATITHIY